MILVAIGEKSVIAERHFIEHACAGIALRFGRCALG